MSEKNENCANRIETLAFLLASGHRRSTAARILGYHPDYVSRKFQDGNFKKLVDGLRNQMISEASGRVSRAASSAAVTLHRVASDKNQDPRIRITAAKAILDSLVRVGEYEALLTRIRRLEEALSNEE